MALEAVDPLLGEDRADLRAATVCATIAEIHRDKDKKATPYTAKDFMPDFEAAAEDSSERRAEELKAKAAAIFGGAA